MKRCRPCFVRVLITALAACIAAQPGAAQTPVAFYKDKQISFIIGYNPGGTYDVYSRLVVPH